MIIALNHLFIQTFPCRPLLFRFPLVLYSEAEQRGGRDGALNRDTGPEGQWIEQVRAGSREAFEALVLHYRPQAVRFAASILHDAFHAEDVAQESFAKVYFHLGDFKTGTSFKSWLFTIIRNKCIDLLRRSKSTLELDEALALGGGDEPEPALLGKEEWRAFQNRWRELPEDTRTALYLFAVEEMGYDQIGRVMGKNTSQVKMLLYRTRKKLKRERSEAE